MVSSASVAGMDVGLKKDRVRAIGDVAIATHLEAGHGNVVVSLIRSVKLWRTEFSHQPLDC